MKWGDFQVSPQVCQVLPHLSGANQAPLRGSVRGMDEALCTQHRLGPGGSAPRGPEPRPHARPLVTSAPGELPLEGSMVRQPHPERSPSTSVTCPLPGVGWTLSSSERQEYAKRDFPNLPWCSAFQLLTVVIIPSPRRQLPSGMPRGHHPF